MVPLWIRGQRCHCNAVICCGQNCDLGWVYIQCLLLPSDPPPQATSLPKVPHLPILLSLLRTQALARVRGYVGSNHPKSYVEYHNNRLENLNPDVNMLYCNRDTGESYLTHHTYGSLPIPPTLETPVLPTRQGSDPELEPEDWGLLSRSESL